MSAERAECKGMGRAPAYFYAYHFPQIFGQKVQFICGQCGGSGKAVKEKER